MRPIIYLLFVAVFSLFFIPGPIHAQTITASQKAQLQQELAQVEAEQKQAQQDLATARSQSSSLSRDITILNAKIKAAQLDIRAKNLLIQTLGNDITTKEKHISQLEERIVAGKQTLSQVLRKTNEIGSASIPELLLSQSSITGFFNDIDTFQSVQDGLKLAFEQLRKDEASTSVEKNALNVRLNTETDARQGIETQKANIQIDQGSKKQLLSISKGNEKAYSTLLAQKEARASQIRAALFALAGGSNAIPFGQALKFAQEASKSTGIRPAFLLAIITQESSLGANVGSCYVTDLISGNGIGKNSGTPYEQVMKSPRDTSLFKEITGSLGREWSTTPVSCPIGSAQYFKGRGFGGGMGPSQFIPSTWNLFRDRIANAFGIQTPDPWNPEHAFTASALYLTDLGAVNGSYSGEIRAACRYYGTGGSSCSYGKQVLAKAYSIQTNMIDPLQGL